MSDPRVVGFVCDWSVGLAPLLDGPYGDGLNREGNYLMRDRIDQLQRRLQRRRIDPARMAMLAHGLHDRAAFLAEVRAFLDRLRTLAAASPKAAAPAKAPVPAAP